MKLLMPGDRQHGRRHREGACILAISRRKGSGRNPRGNRWKGFRRATGIGASPGSLDTVETSGTCTIRRIIYSNTEFNEETLTDAGQLGKAAAAGTVSWIQIHGSPDTDVLKRLATVFGIHSLALEDVANTHQRCKVEDYGSHLFVVTRVPRFSSDHSLTTEQVSLFIGSGFLISIQEDQDVFLTVRDRMIRSRTRLPEMAADFLGYAIIDVVTDHYFPVIEEIGNRLNAVDDLIEEHVLQTQRSEIRDLRADLLLLRRTIWPQRDALSKLLRDDSNLITPATRTYLRDCYDHTVQIIEITETYRELCADLRDYHLSEISHRSNEVMRTLTMIATVFMPLSFIAGFYGMNFQHMPELEWRYSYPLLISIMLLTAASLIWWFRRRGWLN